MRTDGLVERPPRAGFLNSSGRHRTEIAVATVPLHLDDIGVYYVRRDPSGGMHMRNTGRIHRITCCSVNSSSLLTKAEDVV